MAGVYRYPRGQWRKSTHVVFQAALYGGVEVTVLCCQFDSNDSRVDRVTGVCSMEGESYQTHHNNR
jgi:hypothetical protein